MAKLKRYTLEAAIELNEENEEIFMERLSDLVRENGEYYAGFLHEEIHVIITKEDE